MDRFIVYDRKAKRFLASKECKERGDLCSANIDTINTDNGFIMTFNLPRYFIILASEYLPEGVFEEEWIVHKAEHKFLPVLSTMKSIYAYHSDEASIRRYFSLKESRNDHFNALRCVPLSLEGVRTSKINFISNVALLRKIAPELF